MLAFGEEVFSNERRSFTTKPDAADEQDTGFTSGESCLVRLDCLNACDSWDNKNPLGKPLSTIFFLLGRAFLLSV